MSRKPCQQLRLDLINAIKKKGCVDCGGLFHPQQMDMDHRPGSNKVLRLSRMVLDCTNMPTFLAELEKCEAVCANDHRLRTLFRREAIESEVLQC